MTESRSIRFDGRRLTIEDVCRLAARDARAELSADPDFRARIRRGSEFLERLLREDGVVYGVTTGYGDSCTVTVLLCHNFARTKCHYMFESVKSAGWKHR